MKAIFRTFESGVGDCIFLILKDDDNNSYHIMVDCNVLTQDIKNFVINKLQMHIDTLIITHLDSDHVNGITQMMRSKEFEGLEINQILFNGFQPNSDNRPISVDPSIKDRLESIDSLLPPIVDGETHKNSGATAACLVQQLNEHVNWKKVWRKEPILAGTIIPLGSHWGSLHFLSPSKASLDKLLKEVRIEYAKLIGEAPPTVDFQDQEKYYELMIKIAQMRERKARNKKTSAVLLSKTILEKYALIEPNEDEVTAANWASLAFYWQSDDNTKRILMLGDAVSSQVLSVLNEMDGEIWFECVKISHHGSKNNTSVALNTKINTGHYFLTGGKKEEGPHLETLAKFITKPIINDIGQHFLHYNHSRSIDLFQELLSDKGINLLNEYSFQLTKDNKYEFEY